MRLSGLQIAGTFFILLLLSFPPALLAADSPTLSGCDLFPEDNIWNTSISTLPVAAGSDEFI